MNWNLLQVQIPEILVFLMVPLAVGIISSPTIQEMINLYRVQSSFLALIAIFLAFSGGEISSNYGGWFFVYALIPGLLAIVILPLLSQATVSVPAMDWLARIFSRKQVEVVLAHQKALRIWEEHGLSRRVQRTSLVFSLVLTMIAYGVAFSIQVQPEKQALEISIISLGTLLFFILARQVASLITSFILSVGVYFIALFAFWQSLPLLTAFPQPLPGLFVSTQHSLAVAVTLLLLGIYTMITRQDLISQVIGLLVMDHGLFLAAMRVVPTDLLVLIPAFAVSLVLYILITVLILIVLLPQLQQASNTLEVSEQSELKG